MDQHQGSPAEFAYASVEHVEAIGGEVGPLKYNLRSFVVRRESELALVDTMFPQYIDEIEKAVKGVGSQLRFVKYVLLTHRHSDHISGLPEVLRRAPHALVFAGEADIEQIRVETGVTPNVAKTGDKIFDFEVIATPGHTMGHLCFFDSGSSTMIIGDVAGDSSSDSPRLKRPPKKWNDDSEKAEQSLIALAGRNFDVALPSHGDPILSGADREIRRLVSEYRH